MLKSVVPFISDAENDPIVYRIVGATNGTARIASGGASVSFTPTTGFFGTGSFSIVAGMTRLTIVKDELDNRILECAVAAEANVIVTGDRHLLLLKQYQGIRVIRLTDFLSRF